MSALSHYFNQSSINPTYYFKLNGMINNQKFSLLSAKWLFSATSFDLGTRILLKYFYWHHKDQVSVLDFGCGYWLVAGFLASQYLQKKFPDIAHLHIDACDSSPLAVDVTTTNLKYYMDKILTHHIICSDLLSDNYFSDKKYTTILSNPPFSAGKKIVKEFIQLSYDHLLDWWILWMVVPTNKWAKSYITITESIFWKNNIKIIALEAGYRVRVATK
jgi:16S rRNA (guanine1207-N2)-methyltransferase